MIMTIRDDFDLDKIAESGQCFRFERLNPQEELPAYRILADDKCLYITALGDQRYELDCREADFEDFWQDYFDLRENYGVIRARIDKASDPFLNTAAENEKGIRILRQDPWEMLITFIISQNRNIPAIKRSVEMLAAACGQAKTDSRGRSYYAFPAPEAVARLSQDQLSDCKLGYRCKYISAAAAAVLEGCIDLASLKNADTETAINTLTDLYGVGRKVASCVALFGLHHVDAFPIDVWVKRILAQEYPDGYPYEKYSPYNGIYQQYMFAWYRHR